MAWLDITTNIGCPNACVYCPQEETIKAYAGRSDATQMSFDTFKVCVDRVPADVAINFSGFSEPWLNTECAKMLLYAHERGHRIYVFSTLTGLTLPDIDRIRTVPIACFYVHLPSEEGYEKIKIDEDYLKVLRGLLESGIKVKHICLGEKIHHRVKPLIKTYVNYLPASARSGNTRLKRGPAPGRKRGAIGCGNDLRANILLPSGEVALCCMDFGLKHVLGNLLYSDYDSLFRGEEFLKVKKGLRRGRLNILCRYCDTNAFNADLFAKVYNSFFLQLTAVRNIKDVRRLGRAAGSRLRRLLPARSG